MKYLAILERDGALLIEKTANLIRFRCACGAETEKSAQNLYKPQVRARCTPCGKKAVEKTNNGRVDLHAIRAYFFQTGCFPLFFRMPGGQHQNAPFICVCGQHSTYWLTNRYKGLVPRCDSCSNRARRKPGAKGRWGSRGKAFYVWARRILVSADYTCAVTGRRGGDLEAHHLWNWAHHPDKRYDLSNGVCVSAEHHARFHSIYGKGNNTPAQFAEYLELCRADG